MNCPVCNKADISLDKSTCPECGSDLEAVVFINRLDDKLKKIRKNLVIVSIIVAVLLIASLVCIYALNKSRSKAIAQNENYQSEIKSLKSKNDSLLKSFAPKEQQTEKTGSTEVLGNFKLHTVKSGDSLWKLAQQYLGDGNKYLKIATDNKLEKPYLLKEGQELKIISE